VSFATNRSVTSRLTFTDKLLRLRKDISTTPRCADAQTYWEQHIQPLFNSDDIVNQSLFRLEPELVTRLSNELREWEKGTLNGSASPERARHQKRRGTYLAYDEHGLLVTDMTPGLYILEFSWLEC
jgi:inositol-pentakisphosphate 2-kinase